MTKSPHFWADAMASDGFVVECVSVPNSERFSIMSREPSSIPGLHKIPADSWPARSSSPVKDYLVSSPLTEADLRSTLTQAGLSSDAIETKLEWARQWATTITRTA
jgi:hypothetical protein